MSTLFEDFSLFPGAMLKGPHVSLVLKDIVDVYSPQNYELAGGGRLPEQRSAVALKGAGHGLLSPITPHYIPGNAADEPYSVLARGDLPDELRESVERSKKKLGNNFKTVVQRILILAARKSRVKCAVLLIDEFGADVNGTSNNKKHSPLHFAAYNGDLTLAKELLKRGASKTLTNSYDETPDQTAHNEMERNEGDEEKRESYQECRDLIADFQLTAENAAGQRQSGLENISTYVPTSQSSAIVDTYQALSRASMSLLNKITDDNEDKMVKRLEELVPVSGFKRPDRKEKFEIRHFQVMVENLWKTAIAQPAMAGLFASLASKLHEHFTNCVKDIVSILPTNSGMFYRMIFDEKLVAPLYDTETEAFTEGAKCVNFKRELLTQCQNQFNSERDLSRFRREIDWSALTDELELLRAQNDVMYKRNKAQDRMTANIVFIGQLYNHGLATTSIVKMCVEDLLPESRILPEDVRNDSDKHVQKDYIAQRENDVAMLVKLIEVIGMKFEKDAPPASSGAGNSTYEKAKRDADRRKKLLSKWFKALKKITGASLTGAEGEFKMQNRVRFAVQDLVELRHRGWVTRGLAIKGKKGATTDDDGWTSVSGGPSVASTTGPSQPTTTMSAAALKKKHKAQRKAEKARKAAEARALELAKAMTEINKEAQRLADEIRVLDSDSERIRIQISKHMQGPKQAKARRKMNLRLKKNKQERNKLKNQLKLARVKGPDKAVEPEKAPAAAAEAITASGAGDVGFTMPPEEDFFELPPLKNEAKVKGMMNEFLEVTQDFAEFSLSMKEMNLPNDEAIASVVNFLLMYACESLSSSTKRKHLDHMIALLKHLLANGDVTQAQFDLAVKALDCLIDDIKMDAPLAGKVYDEIVTAIKK